MAQSIYRTAAWRAVRERVLRRDGFVCQLRFAGCRVAARSVDHIVRPEEGGAPYDEQNLQAACVRCNTVKRNRMQAARARRYDGLVARQW